LEGEELNPLPVIPFPNFESFCLLLKKLRKKLLVYGICNCKHFVQTYIDYLQACAWESAFNTLHVFGGLTDNIYFDIREYTIAVIPLIELQAVMRGIFLPERIRNDPLVLAYNRHVAKQMTLINDLFSFNKENLNNEVHNYINILNKQIPLDQSFAMVFKQANECVQSLIALEEFILKKYPKDPMIVNYLRIGKTWVDGNLQWSILNTRYGYDYFVVHASVCEF